MNNPTYQERVQAIEDEIFNAPFTGESLCKISARIAVKHMAKMFEKGFKIGKFNYIDPAWEQLPPEEIEPFKGLMRANGLIPDSGEPVIIPVQPGDRWPPAAGMENKPLDTTGKWFNVQCQQCGWTGSSEYLDGGGQIADTGDYSDAYCPNCGQIDPDEYTPDSGQEAVDNDK